MLLNSRTEENYLKVIYKLCKAQAGGATTNSIAETLGLRAATVSDMLQRLAEKELVDYTRYYGVSITEKGKRAALDIIRRHRLWEVFLVNKLNFKWDEVHVIAEELEHVSSQDLIERLDRFLGHPKTDPHGDPIPDSKGKMSNQKMVSVAELAPGDSGIISGVKEHSSAFLKFVEKSNLKPGSAISITDKNDFDHSIDLVINKKKELHISHEVAKNLLVKTEHGK